MMKSKRPRLLVVGSSNTDLVARCSHLPKPGETLSGCEFARLAGGKGANQAVAAARAGVQVTFVGARGEDDFGRFAEQGLRDEGIDVTYFRTLADTPSGVALILIGGRARQNMIAVVRSANDCLAPEHVRKARSAFSEAGAVVSQREIPQETVEAAAILAREHDVPFILNPAPATGGVPVRILRQVYVLTPNEVEIEELTGCSNPADGARILCRRGAANVIVTLGARGALVVSKEGERRLPAPRVTPVDTVGAGDCFTGWLAAGIAGGLSVDQAAARAILAASIAVTRQGAQAGMPYRKEVEDFDRVAAR